MTDNPQPVLVYDRIDENRQNTRLLMVLFVLLLLPLAGGVAQYVTPQSLFMRHISTADVEPTIQEILTELWAAMVVLLLIAGGTLVIFTAFSSSLLLQHVRARPVTRKEQPALWKTVENLCIGAGLPMPALYLMQSDVANAFAIGHDPKQASLVVTTGLLSLLTPRELTAVIAHELSHIGNYDTQLSTMLAAIVALLRAPWNACVMFFRLIKLLGESLGSNKDDDSSAAPIGQLLWFLINFVGPTLLVMASAFTTISLAVVHGEISPAARIWRLLGIAAIPYALFGVPYLATSLRRMISQEREFLADADAVLLTRDPDGLALALAKVESAGWGVKAGAATSHLYFVDPLPAARSWWDWLYQLHPPVSQRIGRIAAMDDGVPEAEILAAIQVGKDYAEQVYHKDWILQLPAHLRPVEKAPSASGQDPVSLTAHLAAKETVPGASFRLTRAVTPLYEQADGWSRIIKQLPEGSIVTPSGQEGNFIRVATSSGSGYVPRGALAVRAGATAANKQGQVA